MINDMISHSSLHPMIFYFWGMQKFGTLCQKFDEGKTATWDRIG
jgi:hypothetical protein